MFSDDDERLQLIGQLQGVQAVGSHSRTRVLSTEEEQHRGSGGVAGELRDSEVALRVAAAVGERKVVDQLQVEGELRLVVGLPGLSADRVKGRTNERVGGRGVRVGEVESGGEGEERQNEGEK